jgi:hypothetical protein
MRLAGFRSSEPKQGVIMRRLLFAIWALFGSFFLAHTCALAVEAVAHCSATGRFGLGEGDTVVEATDDAVSKCIVGGGVAGCCHVMVTTEDASCIALATGPGTQRGFSSSNDRRRAERLAIQECGSGCRLRVSRCESD